MEHQIKIPFSLNDAKTLHCGDKVLLSGIMYTARDEAHKCLDDLILNGEPLPIDLKDQVLFYAGPTPVKPGEIVGSIGPTTSARMDSLTTLLIRSGLRGMIGKGNRSESLKDVIRGKAVYFVAIGGAAVLLAESITKMEVAAFADLGPEAIYRLEVKNFPCYVAIDLDGKDLFQECR